MVNNDFSQEESWKRSLCKSIENRYLVKKIFISNNSANSALSFLELEFVKEHIYAEALYLSILNFTAKTETEKSNYIAKAKALKEKISLINVEKETIFNRSKSYLEDVIANK